MATPVLDVIMITHGHMALTIRCVNALYQNTSTPFHLIVMDDSTPDMDNGTDMTQGWFEKFSKVHDNVTFVHSREPYKSSLQIFRQAFGYCHTPYVAVVVNSMIVEPEWELAALQLMQSNPTIGMMGFKCLRYGTELIESAGMATSYDGSTLSDIGRGQSGHRLSKVYECDTVQWAFVLLRLEAVQPNLGEDVYHGFKGWEEFETCFTMRKAGWHIFYCGLGIGYHQTLATRIATGPDDIVKNMQNREIFAKRWGFWTAYHKINPGAGEFFPDMPLGERLPPVVIIDPTGVVSRGKLEKSWEVTNETSIIA